MDLTDVEQCELYCVRHSATVCERFLAHSFIQTCSERAAPRFRGDVTWFLVLEGVNARGPRSSPSALTPRLCLLSVLPTCYDSKGEGTTPVQTKVPVCLFPLSTHLATPKGGRWLTPNPRRLGLVDQPVPQAGGPPGK